MKQLRAAGYGESRTRSGLRAIVFELFPMPYSLLSVPYSGFLITDLEGRGLRSCGKTLPCRHPEPIRCHSERSEGSRSEHFQGNARLFVAAAPQNDSALEFFRRL